VSAAVDELRRLPDGRSIWGQVEDGYGVVLDTFGRNFTERNDLGAACTVVRDGRTVVDLWGGVADSRSGRAWDRDTTAVIFSCSKGLVSLTAYLLVQDGRLNLDAPIARYWPEFATNGKGAITVRQAMSHRAGLPALSRDLTLDEVVEWDPVIHAIEREAPTFAPSEGHVYHAMTHGWLVGEVIRRITGSRPGAFFAETVAKPLGLSTWIGLPDAARPAVAWMEPPLPDEDSEAARQAAALVASDPLIERSHTMGGAYAFPALDGVVTFNDPVIQAAEIPAANGISTARSLARLYGACVASVDGVRLLTSASVTDALREQAAGPQLSGLPDDGARWGTGFQIASPPAQPMLGPTSFGHAGAGGQLAFADADRGIGFAYLSNQMGGYGDARARSLTEALSRALAGAIGG
jgi:CubicO group peptidase (beta-lactamase class C family)